MATSNGPDIRLFGAIYGLILRVSVSTCIVRHQSLSRDRRDWTGSLLKEATYPLLAKHEAPIDDISAVTLPRWTPQEVAQV